MKLLALDTSTEACSAALWIDGEVRERYALTPADHGRHILAMVDGVLAEAGIDARELDALAFGRGPGGFTGLRIAAGVVQGLALALGLPVAPVSSLAALAQGAMRERGAAAVLAAIDARMNELYWGAFEADADGCARLRGEELLAPAAQIALPDAGSWWGAGSGWSAAAAELSARLGPRLAGCDGDRYPRAADVAVLAAVACRAGRTVPADEAVPVYLRDRVVQARGSAG